MKINDKHLANYASSKELPDKEGWLWKKGEVNTSYQKRWCVLRGNLFFYFEKRQDKEPIGVIVLENCSVQLAEGGDSPFTFSIQFAGEGTRTYKLTADDDDQCMSWVKVLSSCSYRYLEILVDALQREFDTLNSNRHNNLEIQEPWNANSALPLSLTENHFSQHKSSSVNNIANMVDDDNDNFMRFDASSEDLSTVSPKLNRSQSTNELSTSSLNVGQMDQLKPVNKAKKLKKLSPHLGRKKGNKYKERSSPSPTQSNQNGVLDENEYVFIEMHQQLYKQIQAFVANVESAV
uniref:Sesquipedalian-2 n=1 Tax=Phallusia mammillata TaxID=59560 RepID=A0A6F9DN19_9ASCI|nr:sesquipedalian-2 [Phallusia mammillata]